ncbi:MAG: hypothetical protein ACYDH9_14190 [Limisphaerales bacterium]
MNTVDKRGQRHRFVYGPPEEDVVAGDSWDEGARTFTYRIKTKPEDEEFFDFTVQEEQQARLRVTMMHNHSREEYTSKGVSEAMITTLAEASGKTVTSSSNKAGPGEYRTVPADKIWKRLVQKGLAQYNSDEDRYYAILRRHDTPACD